MSLITGPKLMTFTFLAIVQNVAFTSDIIIKTTSGGAVRVSSGTLTSFAKKAPVGGGRGGL